MDITVVGIGADGIDSVSRRAEEAIGGAEVIVGSTRQLDLVRSLADTAAETITWPSPLVPAIPAIFHPRAGRRVVVLASGNPLFHGIASTLQRELPDARISVIPALSSLSLACARLCWSEHDTPHVSLVTGQTEAIGVLVDSGHSFMVLAKNKESTDEVCAFLRDAGAGESTVTVLADLGASTETITVGRADHPPAQNSGLAIIAVEPAGAPTRSLAPGREDSCYLSDGQLTKQDIRAVTVCALAPVAGELLWDIGGGSGSVSIEWLRLDPRNRARTFEHHPTRRERITANARALGVPHLQVSGAAPENLPGSEQPDCIFVGGGLTVPGLPDTLWSRLRPGGRLVANGVTAETVALLWELKRAYGGSLRRISVENETSIGSFTAYKPAYPVWQWRVTKPMTPDRVVKG